MQFRSFIKFESALVLLFTLSRQVFPLQGQWPFWTVTTIDDCLFRCFYRFSHRAQVWPLVRITASISNLFLRLRIFNIYHPGDWLPPTIFNVVVVNVGHRVMMLYSLCRVVMTLWCQMRRAWLIPRRQLPGGGGGSVWRGGLPRTRILALTL